MLYQVLENNTLSNGMRPAHFTYAGLGVADSRASAPTPARGPQQPGVGPRGPPAAHPVAQPGAQRADAHGGADGRFGRGLPRVPRPPEFSVQPNGIHAREAARAHLAVGARQRGVQGIKIRYAGLPVGLAIIQAILLM